MGDEDEKIFPFYGCCGHCDWCDRGHSDRCPHGCNDED